MKRSINVPITNDPTWREAAELAALRGESMSALVNRLVKEWVAINTWEPMEPGSKCPLCGNPSCELDQPFCGRECKKALLFHPHYGTKFSTEMMANYTRLTPDAAADLQHQYKEWSKKLLEHKPRLQNMLVEPDKHLSFGVHTGRFSSKNENLSQLPPRFVPEGGMTGRMSSTSPNLQELCKKHKLPVMWPQEPDEGCETCVSESQPDFVLVEMPSDDQLYWSEE